MAVITALPAIGSWRSTPSPEPLFATVVPVLGGRISPSLVTAAFDIA